MKPTVNWERGGLVILTVIGFLALISDIVGWNLFGRFDKLVLIGAGLSVFVYLEFFRPSLKPNGPPMRLDSEIDSTALAALGVEAMRLLCSGDISVFANRFGYARAFDREPAAAIREDLNRCLNECGATALKPMLEQPEVSVKHFKPNAARLLALLESVALAENDAKILIELVVTGDRSNKYITLEDVSVVTDSMGEPLRDD